MIAITKAIELGLGIIDKVIPNPEAKAAANLKLMELAQAGGLKELDAAMSIIVAEAKSDHWLTANWRPITMLTFVGLITAHWFGFTAPNLTEAERLLLLELVRLGIGGYIIGRSGEKIATAVAEKWQQ